MFKPLGLLQASRCPDEPCHRPYCFFAHSQPTSAAGPSKLPARSVSRVDPVPVKRKVGESDLTSEKKKAKVESATRAEAGRTSMTTGEAAAPARSAQPVQAVQSAATSTISKRPAVSTQSVPARTTATSIASGPSRSSNALLKQSSGAPSVSREAKDLRASKHPYADRQKALQTLWTQYTKLYSALSNLEPDLASKSSLEEESEISASSADLKGYKRAIHHAAVSVSRRVPPTSLDHPSVGTVRQSREATAKAEKAAASRLTQERCKRYLLPLSDFEKWRYPDPGNTALLTGGDTDPDGLGSVQKCDRCESDFKVSTVNLEQRRGECMYHHGKVLPEKIEGKRKWVYSCCHAERGSPGCQRGVHIFSEREDDMKLASRIGFRTVTDQAEENASGGRIQAFAEVVGVDCEMIYTTAGYSLARATVVDEKGQVIFDELVRQTAGILDLNTRFSGITAADLAGAVMDIRAVRAAACMFIGPDTIIAGHGLENDLRALRLLHDRVIDTAVLFPHPKGPPFRRALRDLVKEKLGYFIQQQTTNTGHSSAEDARATLEVLQSKVREDASEDA